MVGRIETPATVPGTVAGKEVAGERPPFEGRATIQGHGDGATKSGSASMKTGRIVAGVAALGVLGVVAPQKAASADHRTAEVTFTEWNPCTGEEVQITTTLHFLVFSKGDLTHNSDGSGVGLTSGTAYQYIRRGFETNMHGFFEVIHLISAGPASDLTLHDDLGDSEDPVIVCS